MTQTYLVATRHPWNIKVYHERISKYPGKWHLVTERDELTVDLVKRLNPRFIFFPHWSWKVSKEILELSECVCFHAAPLPEWRGSSVIQHQIEAGETETVMSAIRMVDKLDAGPIYLQRPLSLDGLAEEIYIRAADMVSMMILRLIYNNIQPKEQTGKGFFVKRRTPDQSVIPKDRTLDDLFDYIRMLDAQGYPAAFIEHNGFRFEFTRPALRTGKIQADVTITELDND